MRSLPPRVRLAVVCAGMLAIAAALACTCSLPLSLRPTPTETLPPVLVATQPEPTAETLEPTASVTVSPTVSAPIVITATKSKATPTITLTSAPPPGGGSYGLTQSDLELYGVTRVSDIGAATTITLDVRNLGPSAYEAPLRVVCVGAGFMLADPGQACSPAMVDTTVTIAQGVGTGHFNVDLLMTSPACYYPGVQCSLIPSEGKDPNPDNNQYGFSLP